MQRRGQSPVQVGAAAALSVTVTGASLTHTPRHERPSRLGQGVHDAREREEPGRASLSFPGNCVAPRSFSIHFFSTFPPLLHSRQPAGGAPTPTPPPVSRHQSRREAAEDAALAAAADGAAPIAPPADPKMADFFAEVAAIKASLAGIRDAQAALSRAHEQSKTVTRGREMTAIREQMQVCARRRR